MSNCSIFIIPGQAASDGMPAKANRSEHGRKCHSLNGALSVKSHYKGWWVCGLLVWLSPVVCELGGP